MLIREHLPAHVDLDHLSSQTGIPEDRIRALAEGREEPYTHEIGDLAVALSVDPVHLFRSSPLVLAQRSGTDLARGYQPLLVEFDLHVAVYGEGLAQEIPAAIPSNSGRGARRLGEGWPVRAGVREYDYTRDDPLIEAVEQKMGIPVLYWPIPGAPFGATVRFEGVVGIWVNTAGVPRSQQRFTLAHEVGHLLLGHVGDLRVEPSENMASVGRGLPQAEAKEESHAHHFASGTLGDYETVKGLWDGAARPESIAYVAAHVGGSYDATVNLLKEHFPRERNVLEEARGAPVRLAYYKAGLEDVYNHFEEGRDARRMPGNLANKEALEVRLRRALS